MLNCDAGTSFSQPGDLIGGLTEQAASDLGLMVGTPVGASIIDAHAGGVGWYVNQFTQFQAVIH